MTIPGRQKSLNPEPAQQTAKGSPTVAFLALDAIRPNPRNPRTHSKKQLRLIAESIQRFGFLNPLIVDETGTLLAGHGRWEAAKLANLGSVPVIRFDHLSPAQKRAYLIADNRIAEHSGWDRDILAAELGELIELLPTEGLDVSVTGFAVAEIDLLLEDVGPSRPEPEDELPKIPSEPVSHQGDLWLLGKHRLLCGDAREPGDLLRLMNGSLASAAFCDPPYNVRVSSIGGRGRARHKEFAFASGEMSQSQYRDFLAKTLINGVQVSMEGAVHFICMDWRHIEDLVAVGRDNYQEMLNLVVWNKSNGGQGAFYRSQHELIVVFRTGKTTHRNNIELGRFGRNRSNVWTYAGVNTFGRDRLQSLSAHPTVKPIRLVADAILDCTSRGDVILDQFVGSGTTILAAEKVARVGFGLEFEPRYVDVAIQRWQEMTKLEAILETDGRTFAELGAARRESKTGAKAQGRQSNG